MRYRDALACVEALSAAAALRRSLDLHPLGDWTDDARELLVFPQDAYPQHAGAHDYTRAVLHAEPPSLERPRAQPRGSRSHLALSCLAAVVALGLVASASAETWRGLTVAPEYRCAPYDKKRDYPYPQSVERDIVRELGAVYGPYTGTCFASTTETDIEHIVAASEAHDSGLCARDAVTKARFARDLRNLTLASPRVNCHEKSGKDAAAWVPERNRCWFAARVLEVRLAYDLTIDRRESAALDRILAGCVSTELEPVVCAVPSASPSVSDPGPAAGDDGRRRRWPPATMHSLGTTTIETAGSPATKRVGTGSHRSRVRTRPIASCETGMVSCASSGANVDVCFPLVAPCRDAVFSC